VTSTGRGRRTTVACVTASVVLVVAVQACAPKSGADSTKAAGGMAASGTAAGIDSLRQTWQNDYNRRDAAALAAHYTEDAVSIAPNGTINTGRAAIQNNFPKDSTMWGTATIAPSKPAVISGNSAWEVGTAKIQTTTKGKPMTITENYLVLLQADGGQWKIRAAAGVVDSAANASMMRAAPKK